MKRIPFSYSLPTSTEVKKIWINTSTPQYAFMEECLISYAHGQLYHSNSIEFCEANIVNSSSQLNLF